MKAVKYSRQRELIKNYLMSRTDHPTAEAVYEAIGKYARILVWGLFTET